MWQRQEAVLSPLQLISWGSTIKPGQAESHCQWLWQNFSYCLLKMCGGNLRPLTQVGFLALLKLASVCVYMRTTALRRGKLESASRPAWHRRDRGVTWGAHNCNPSFLLLTVSSLVFLCGGEPRASPKAALQSLESWPGRERLWEHVGCSDLKNHRIDVNLWWLGICMCDLQKI